MVECDSEPKVKKCSAWLLLVLILIVAMGAWLMSVVNGIATSITCIIEQVTILAGVSDDMGMGDMVAALPLDVLEMVKPYVSLLPVAAIVPGVLVILNLLLVIICSVLRSNKSAYSPKFLICTTSLLILVGIALYSLLGVLGYMVTTPEVKPLIEGVAAICDELVPSINSAVLEAEGMLEQAEDLGWSNFTEVETQLEASKVGMAAIDDACVCIPDLLFGIESLTSPAIAAAIMLVLAYVSSCGLCCKLGCCRSPSTNKVAIDA